MQKACKIRSIFAGEQSSHHAGLLRKSFEATWNGKILRESFFFARGQICPDFFVSVIYLAGTAGKKRAKKKDGAGKKRAKKKDGAGKKRAKKSIRNTTGVS